MGKLVKVFVLFFLVCTMPSFASIKGGVEYAIPIDYSAINEEEYSSKADVLYSSIKDLKKSKVNSEITEALNFYAILSMKNPENLSYAIRLGKIYDVIGKDRQAKGCFYRAIGLNQSDPEAYFYMGELFFERKQYRHALKFYKKAYERGYQNHPETVKKLKTIYKKFGDKSALETLEK